MKRIVIAITIVLGLATGAELYAGATSKVVQEVVEYMMRKFGKEVAEELGENAAEIAARKTATLVAKHGDEVVIAALKKAGPRVFRLVEEGGEDGAAQALKLLARHGDEAVWVIAKPKRLALFIKLGDDAADAMIRHREIAEPLIEQFGTPAARAMKSVDWRNGRRLAMLADDGTLAKVPHCDQLLDTIGKYGNAAADWVWRNKGAITVAAVVSAFVSNPQPFIDGTVDVAEIAAGSAVGLAGAVVEPVVTSAAQGINWNLLLGIPLMGITAWLCWRLGRRWLKEHRPAAASAQSPGPAAVSSTSSQPTSPE